jgi:hypothetical protein
MMVVLSRIVGLWVGKPTRGWRSDSHRVRFREKPRALPRCVSLRLIGGGTDGLEAAGTTLTHIRTVLNAS